MFEEARAEASKMRAASHLESARQRAAWGANAGGGQARALTRTHAHAHTHTHARAQTRART
eukprot:2889264-Pleurochrysis_carterae.AAC.4